ncbi:DUF952 domain-containing protein [Rhodococcus gannanensis]|uniref:DUF952 domain-containing protein n=1 Tax=Rhodococcus gannanensis TaxID=1960308 RepID=A0ABW4P7Y8_9NOCA
MCTAAEWDDFRATGTRRPVNFDADGFVHLSTRDQVHLPANRLFGGREDVVLLHLDPARLGAEIRWEPGVPTDPDSMLFPHLYGLLPADAVVAVTPYLPGPDGLFGTPPLP